MAVAKEVLRDVLMASPPTRRTRIALRRASLVLAWSAFEVLAKDVWIACVNQQPARYIRATLGDARKKKKKTVQVSVDIDQLDEYQNDLAGHLGDVLSARYDFTSVSKIEDAYRAIFGECPNLVETPGDKRLHDLEQIRHIIVHNAAKADAKFRRQAALKLALGQELIPEAKQVTELTEGAIFAGCALIRAADKELSTM